MSMATLLSPPPTGRGRMITATFAFPLRLRGEDARDIAFPSSIEEGWRPEAAGVVKQS